ncbi:MAG: ribonuclease R [Bacteroidota bacterium]
MSKKNRKHNNSNDQLVKGKLEITRSGMGYVLAEDGEGDILVRPADFNKAFNGDKVRVQIKRPAFRDKKREGVIVDVISRKQTDFIGTLRGHAGRWFFLPDGDKPLPHFDLEDDPDVAVDEEGKVIVRFISWEKGQRRPIGKFIDVVRQEDMGDMAMKSILLEKGFPLSFSDDAMEAALRMSEHISEKELKKRKDFREVLTFTIDPVDAKDFDDALSIKILKDGLFEIGVHIADVSYFVEEETALDDEAYQRATSVYLPDRVNPMLPERISNELCSLRPHEDKYTFSAVFQINSKAEVKKSWLGRTVIHSNHRFSYEEVQEIIETGEGIYKDEIKLLNDLARKFRKKRFDNGAINFSSQEVRFKLDDTGKPIGIIIKENKEANQLIEEFMLLANRTVATSISKIEVKGKPLPFPYRIHDTPDEEKLVPFIALARKFGYSFNTSDPNAIAASFNAMLNAARGTPQQHLLEQLGIRTMAKAIYTSENIGHYGLGFEHYCHFTSPIRRYPDVIVHRVLQQVLDGKIVPDKKMEEKCKHSSERERAAMECERASNKYKQVEYMSQFLGEEFDAVVTGVSSFGFWAETVEHKCEGLISMKDLNYYDDFRLVEADYTLVGLRSVRKFRIGDLVKIKVMAASLEKRQLDYEWIVKAQTEPDKVATSISNDALTNTPDRLSGIPLEAAVIKAKIEASRDRKSSIKKGKATIVAGKDLSYKKSSKKKEKKAIPETAPIPKAIKKKISGK